MGRNARHFLRLSARRGLVLTLVLAVIVVLFPLLVPRVLPLGTGLLNRMLARVTTAPGARLTVGELHGSSLTNLELLDLRLTRERSALAVADTVRIGLRLWPLLHGQIDLRTLQIAGLHVSREILNSDVKTGDGKPTDWKEVLRGDLYHGPALRVERLTVRDGNFGSHAPSVSGANIVASNLLVAPYVTCELDQLSLRYTPAPPDSAHVELWLSASLSPTKLLVDTLRVRRAQSEATGRLSLTFGTDGGIQQMAVAVNADSLDLADLKLLPDMPNMRGKMLLSAALRGPTLDQLDGRVHVGWAAVEVGTTNLQASNFTAQLEGGRAELNGRTALGGADVDFSGWIRPLDEAPSYELNLTSDEPLLLPGLEALRERTSSRWQPRATLQLRGRGYGPQELQFVGALEEGDSRIEWRGGLGPPPERAWKLSQLTLKDLDLASIFDGVPSTLLDGTLSAHGHLADLVSQSQPGSGQTNLLRRLSAEGRIELRSTAIAPKTRARGTIEIQLRSGELKFSTIINSDAGKLSFKAASRPFDAQPKLVLSEGEFEDLDLGSWAPGVPGTQMNGDFVGEIELRRHGTLEVRVAPSRVGTRELSGGTLKATLADDQLVLASHLELESQAVELLGNARIDEGNLHGSVSATLPFGLLASYVNRDSLPTDGSVTIDAEFANLSGVSPRVETRITARGEIGACTIDSLQATARLENGVLAVDSLELLSNVGTVHASGELVRPDSSSSRESDFHAALVVSDPRPALETFDTTRVSPKLQAIIRHLESAQSKLSLQGDSLGAEINVRFDTGEVVDLVGGATQAGDTTQIWLTRAQTQITSTGLRLLSPAEITLMPQRLEIGSLQLEVGEGQIFIDGTFDRRGEEDFRIEAQGIDLASITNVLGTNSLEGRLDGSIEIRGTAAEPEATGTLRIAPIVKGASGGVTALQVRWDGRSADLRAVFHSPESDSLVAIATVPLASPFGDAEPHALGPADSLVTVRIDARNFPLDALSSVLPARILSGVRGRLDAQLRLAGSMGRLEGDGPLTIRDGEFELPSLGVSYSGLQLDAALSGDRFVLRQASVRSQGGELNLTGDVRLSWMDEIEPRLSLVVHEFPLADTPDLHLLASGELEIEGSLRAPVLHGSLDLQDCVYFLAPHVLNEAQRKPEIVLTPDDLRMLEDSFDYQARDSGIAVREAFNRAELDLRVSLERNNWLRKRASPRLAMEVTGDVHAQKSSGGDLELYGSLVPTSGRGYIEHYGRTFDIVDGEVLLNGRMEDHTIDLAATYTVRSPRGAGEPEVVVKFEIQGQIDKLNLIVSSEPVLTESEILSYITTGRSPVRSQTNSQKGGNDAMNLAADFGLSQVTGGLQSSVQEKTGFDVLQVRYDPVLGATLVAGRYLDPRLYATFEQPLQYRKSSSTTGQRPYATSVGLEYELERWLLVNLHAESSLLRAMLRTRHEY